MDIRIKTWILFSKKEAKFEFPKRKLFSLFLNSKSFYFNYSEKVRLKVLKSKGHTLN